MNTTCTSVPVIIEESLINGELHELLKSQQFKIRSNNIDTVLSLLKFLL